MKVQIWREHHGTNICTLVGPSKIGAGGIKVELERLVSCPESMEDELCVVKIILNLEAHQFTYVLLYT